MSTGNREYEPGRDAAPRLAHGRLDLEIDRIPLAAPERRIRAGRQVEVGADVDGVAQVRDDESLQRARRLALEEEREPDDDRHGEGRKPPERDHDQVRDREQEAEDHRHARTLEIVRDDDLNRKAARRVACSATSVTGLVWRLWRSAVAGRSSTIARCRKPSVTPDDVRRAADAIRDAVHRTPTFTSRSLGPGRYLKAELFQRTGSFKARGALNRVRSLSPDERERA